MKKVIEMPKNLSNVRFIRGEIDVNDITSSIPCQRPIDPKRVQMICDTWNSGLANPLRVNILADGTARLVDGQHTCAAFKQRIKSNLELNPKFPCVYAYNLNPEQECSWMLFEDGKSKAQPLSSHVKANLIVRDPKFFSYLVIIESYGFSFPYSNSKGKKKINCISTVLNIPFKNLAQVFYILRECDTNKEVVHADFLRGLSRFVECFDHLSHEDYKILARKISEVSMKEVIRMSKHRDVSPKNRVALVLVDMYNLGQKREQQIDISEACMLFD